LLRDEFSPWIGWKRAIPDRARKILITIGGSDPDNASEQILQSLALLKSSPEDSPGDSEAILVVEAQPASAIFAGGRRPLSSSGARDAERAKHARIDGLGRSGDCRRRRDFV